VERAGVDALRMLLHELAFTEHERLFAELGARLGDSFQTVLATERELPVADAVAAYPFNSQLLRLPDGKLHIVAPLEARENARARAFLERALEQCTRISGIDYLDVNGSMKNGGGPACLRLRVPLTTQESEALGGNVLFDQRLEAELEAIVKRRYRDRLELADIADPELVREACTALDELTQALGLGAIYDFQK
jgi:succinylarginine dihydrolase